MLPLLISSCIFHSKNFGSFRPNSSRDQYGHTSTYLSLRCSRSQVWLIITTLYLYNSPKIFRTTTVFSDGCSIKSEVYFGTNVGRLLKKSPCSNSPPSTISYHVSSLATRYAPISRLFFR